MAGLMYGMEETVHRLDLEVVDLFQWLYNQMLDRFGLKIGTFRMSIALFPIATDILRKASNGDALGTVCADYIFLIGISLFYNLRMMISDDRLQIRQKLRLINSRSTGFRDKFFNVRIFYLFFLCLICCLIS